MKLKDLQMIEIIWNIFQYVYEKTFLNVEMILFFTAPCFNILVYRGCTDDKKFSLLLQTLAIL